MQDTLRPKVALPYNQNKRRKCRLMTWDQKGHLIVNESRHWSPWSFILILMINLAGCFFKSDWLLWEKQRPKILRRPAVFLFKPKACVLRKPAYVPVLSLLFPPEHEDAAMLNCLSKAKYFRQFVTSTATLFQSSEQRNSWHTTASSRKTT